MDKRRYEKPRTRVVACHISPLLQRVSVNMSSINGADTYADQGYDYFGIGSKEDVLSREIKWFDDD